MNIYTIKFNILKNKKTKMFNYKFRKSDVIIEIAKKYASITLNSSKDLKLYDFLTNGQQTFSDAIFKTLLIYILNYSENLKINKIVLEKNHQVCDEKDINGNYIYSLIDGKLFRDFRSKNWTDKEVVEKLLNLNKSDNDFRVSALYAFINSKNKRFEIERFLYLWMTINAMYNYISKILGNNERPEIRKIILLYRSLNFCDEVIPHLSSSYKKKINNEVISVIKQFDINTSSKNDFLSRRNDQLREEIENYLYDENHNRVNIDAYTYVLFYLTYFLRCNTFHAEKPITLFCLENDKNIKCIKIINNLLDDFIETYLPKFFNDNYINNLINNH